MENTLSSSNEKYIYFESVVQETETSLQTSQETSLRIHNSTNVTSIPSPTINEHRSLFLEACTTDPTTKCLNRKSILTQHEYNEHIRIVRYWNETDGHIDSVTGNHVTQQELRSTAAHNWYDKINILRIATTMDDKGNKIDFLERKEKKGNQWKQVVYIENLFDAIRASHGLEHRGLGATKDEAKKKYYNITEHMCRNYIRTCPRCNGSRLKEKSYGSPKLSPKSQKKKSRQKSNNKLDRKSHKAQQHSQDRRIEELRTMNKIESTISTTGEDLTNTEINLGFMDRYSISIIDYSTNPQRDCNQFTLTHVLVVHDNESHWTILRPMNTLNPNKLHEEMTLILCIRGYPSTISHTIIESATFSAIARLFDGIDRNSNDITEDETEVKRKYEWATHCASIDSRVRDEIDEARNQQLLHDNSNLDWIKVLNQVMMKLNQTTQDGTYRFPENNNEIIYGIEQTSTIPTNQSNTINENSSNISDHDIDTNTNFNIDRPSWMTTTTKTSTIHQDNNLPESKIEHMSELDPSTQTTLSMIDEMIEDGRLAQEIKTMYMAGPLDIRSFFYTVETDKHDTEMQFPDDVNTPTHNSNTPEEQNEVQIVSPPPNMTGASFDRSGTPPGKHKMSVNMAMASGRTTSRVIDATEYHLCYPRHLCAMCDQHNSWRIVTFAEDSYYEIQMKDHRWFFPDMMTTFGILCSHDVHRDDIIYIDATLPTTETAPRSNRLEQLSPNVRTLVSVVFTNDHFAVMRLCLDTRRGYFYDGLSWNVKNWSPHMKFILNRYGIDIHDWQISLGRGIDDMDGILIKQIDTSNCGPIACMIIWKLFKPSTINLQEIDPSNYRELVICEIRRMLQENYNSCVVYYKQKQDPVQLGIANDTDDETKTDNRQNLRIAHQLPHDVNHLPPCMASDVDREQTNDHKTQLTVESSPKNQPPTKIQKRKRTIDTKVTSSSTPITSFFKKTTDSHRKSKPSRRHSKKTRITAVTRSRQLSRNVNDSDGDQDRQNFGLVEYPEEVAKKIVDKKEHNLPQKTSTKGKPHLTRNSAKRKIVIESDDDSEFIGLVDRHEEQRTTSSPIKSQTSQTIFDGFTDSEVEENETIGKNHSNQEPLNVHPSTKMDEDSALIPKSTKTKPSFHIHLFTKPPHERKKKHETPLTRKNPRNLEDEVNTDRNQKKRRIVESDDEEWTSEKEDTDTTHKLTNSPPKKMAKAVKTKTDLEAQRSIKKDRSTPLAIDGLGSSDDEDDEFLEAVTPKHVKEKLEASEQKSKRNEKLRIKISMKEAERTPDGKCRCKKECTGHCGCVKQGRKCTIACACRGTCRNGRSP